MRALPLLLWLLIGNNSVLLFAGVINKPMRLLTWRIKNIGPEMSSLASTNLYLRSPSCHVREGENGQTEKPHLALPTITFPFYGGAGLH